MTFSIDDYEKAITRIFDQENNVIGTGFWSPLAIF
jgi:hypothetical protein